MPPSIRLQVLGSLSIEGTGSASNARELISQPKAIAVLVYLIAARPRGFHQRDRMVGLLWPELDQEHARTALRKTVHRLRQACGDDVILSEGSEVLAIAPGAIQCDAVDFDDAVEEDRLREALDLYTGELLPGFFVSGEGDFEDWLERERSYLRERAVTTAWELVKFFAADKQLTNASHLARVVARLASTDERMLRRVLTMMARLGDRAGAVEVYRRFEAQLWKEYQTKPSVESQQLIDDIQKGKEV